MQDSVGLKESLRTPLLFLEDQINLRSLFYTLVAEKWLILCSVIVAIMLGSIIAILKTPQFQATALLQIEIKEPGMGLLPSLSSASMNLTNSDMSSVDIQTALIKSSFILTPVIESLGLDITVQPHYFPVFGKWYARTHNSNQIVALSFLRKYIWGKQSIQLAQMHVASLYEGKIFKLVVGAQNTYKVFTENGSFILEGKVGEIAKESDSGPFHLSLFVQSVDAFPGNEFYITKLSTDHLISQLARKLEISDLGNLYQLSKTGVMQLTLIDANPQSAVNILNRITAYAIQKNIDYKTMQSAKTLKFLNAQLPIVKAELTKTEISLDKYRKRTPTVDLTIKSRQLFNQLAVVQKQIEKVELSRLLLLQKDTELHPQVIELHDKKLILQEELKTLEQQLQALPAPDERTINLTRDIKVKGQLYIELLRKIQGLQVSKAGTVSDIRLLNPAHLPNVPLPINRIRIILISMIVGLISGCLLVYIRKAFYRVVEDPTWLEQKFGLPTFAIIPYSKDQAINLKDSKERFGKYLSLLAHENPRDLAIEALRSLRTSLQFALLGASNNIIGVMGISPGIGKSFVSANFSALLADIGKRVLLIDGDIRKGYLYKYFKAKQAPGLTEAIAGEIAIEHTIQKTEIPNLDLISSGKFPPNPSELLMNESVKELLNTIAAKYDLVIIDTAPILAVTDGVVIGNLTGVNFMLVALGKHQPEEIELAMKRIQSGGVNIQGIIFNTIDARSNTQIQGRYNYSYAYDEV